MITQADVVIAGASFAGLAVARALRGRKVVLVDPHPLGAFPKSACALPLETVRTVGAEDAVLELHPALVLHIGERIVRLPIRSPYATVDYGRFCRVLAEQSDATLLQAHALGYTPRRVYTTAGEMACRFAVDASGPAAVLASSLRPWYTERGSTGAGLEVEVARPGSLPGGLHFYLDPTLLGGYGWAFGCGERVRIGVGVFDAKRQGRALKAAVTQLTARLGAVPGPTHGGLIPLQLREPVVGEVFVVGDAAGQVLPTSAEGIRPALYFGDFVGVLLGRASDGRLSPQAARQSYRREVARRHWGYNLLGQAQRFTDASPPATFGRTLVFGQRLGLLPPVLQRYLRAFQKEPST